MTRSSFFYSIFYKLDTFSVTTQKEHNTEMCVRLRAKNWQENWSLQKNNSSQLREFTINKTQLHQINQM